MTNQNELTAVEQSAAQLFFQVSVQSAFKLEDPNLTYRNASNAPDTDGFVPAENSADIANTMHKADFPEGSVTFETNPQQSPAWSRVLMTGGRADTVIEAVLTAAGQTGAFSNVQRFPLDLPAGVDVPAGTSAERVLLSVNADVNADHDVVLELRSGYITGTTTTALDCLAWPQPKSTA